MILLERVAKAVFHTAGIAQVQSITRPLGTPLDHSSIPFQISAASAAQIKNLPLPAGPRRRPAQAGRRDQQLDRHPAAAVCAATADRRRHRRADQGVPATRSPRPRTCATRSPTSTTSSGRCATTSIGSRTVSTSRSAGRCGRSSTRSTASTQLTDQLGNVTGEPRQAGRAAAEAARADPAADREPADQPRPDADELRHHRRVSTTQTAAALQNATALGQAFDASKNDDSFYLPPEAFNNPDFKRGLKLFLSPDGKAARMIITHDGDPATPEGISHIDAIRHAAHEAIKGTPLAGVQDLHRRHRGDLQGHPGRRQVRPDDRRRSPRSA